MSEPTTPERPVLGEAPAEPGTPDARAVEWRRFADTLHRVHRLACALRIIAEANSSKCLAADIDFDEPICVVSEMLEELSDAADEHAQALVSTLCPEHLAPDVMREARRQGVLRAQW